MLKKAAPAERAAEIEAAMGRLVSQTRTGMGRLFKVIGFAHEKFGVLPGFES
jgi:SAM-dependent MidA family methyltransferase